MQVYPSSQWAGVPDRAAIPKGRLVNLLYPSDGIATRRPELPWFSLSCAYTTPTRYSRLPLFVHLPQHIRSLDRAGLAGPIASRLITKPTGDDENATRLRMRACA